jgi:hypothetical protein
MNFTPRMNPDRLLAGYRSVLQRIYAHDAYYARVKLMLQRAHTEPKGRLSYANLRALFVSLLRQGVFSSGRSSYWRFLFSTLLRSPRSFGLAMTLAVKGYHFQVMTERLMEAGV